MRNFFLEGGGEGGRGGGKELQGVFIVVYVKKKLLSGIDNEKHLRVALKFALRPRTWFPGNPVTNKEIEFNPHVPSSWINRKLFTKTICMNTSLENHLVMCRLAIK